MKRISLTETAHQIIANDLHQGDLAIDATVGNGHDTLFLAQQVGRAGQVYGLDIQNPAIMATTMRLKKAQLLDTVTLFQSSHINLAKLMPASLHGHFQAIMFNLGYLPGGDKTQMTQAESTLQALSSAINLLSISGVLTIMVYPGHVGGDEEARAIQIWLRLLDNNRFKIRTYFCQINNRGSPQLHIIEKKGQ